MFLKYFIIVVLFYICVVSEQNKCCSGPRNILWKGKCIDGANITGLLCSRRYLLTKTIENFTIAANGSLLDHGDTPIPVERYCLSDGFLNYTDVALICFSEKQSTAATEDLFFL